MAMTNIRIEREHMNEEYKPSAYPYGAEIYLDGETCEKLGITELMRAGQQVYVQAIGIVKRASEELEGEDDSGGKDVSLCIQLTDMEVRPKGDPSAARAATMLYGPSE